MCRATHVAAADLYAPSHCSTQGLTWRGESMSDCRNRSHQRHYGGTTGLHALGGAKVFLGPGGRQTLDRTPPIDCE
jgi:hypothetical protein